MANVGEEGGQGPPLFSSESVSLGRWEVVDQCKQVEGAVDVGANAPSV